MADPGLWRQRIGNWRDPSVLIGIYQETITADMQAAVESVGVGAPVRRTSKPHLKRA